MTRTTKPSATSLRLVLRVLDHQVVGPDGELLGNVDDLELEVGPQGWVVTNLCVGPAALGRRLPGKLGHWTTAVWSRLQTHPEPGPAMVPMTAVTEVGSAVEVGRAAADALAASAGFEHWLRTYVVGRIPGAKGGGDGRTEHHPEGTTAAPGASVRPYSGASVSDLLGCRVLGNDRRELGVVTELWCARDLVRRPVAGLRVTHLEYGSHAATSALGYNADAGQGPWLVGALVRWWQRDNRVASWEDVVDLDLESGTVQLDRHEEHRHPHHV